MRSVAVWLCLAVSIAGLSACEGDLAPPQGPRRAVVSPTFGGSAESEIMAPGPEPLVTADLPEKKGQSVEVHTILEQNVPMTQPATRPRTRPADTQP